MKAFFFDIFGTLVDWRSSIMEGAKNLKFFNERRLELEEFVTNWRKEYQPILNKVNDSTLPWKTLDELHEYTLEKVLKKMNFDKVSKKDKKYLVMLWHKIKPWNDSCIAIDQLNNCLLYTSPSPRDRG